MSVDLSGEITAIATAVLAAFAIVTAWYARRAFGWRGRGPGRERSRARSDAVPGLWPARGASAHTRITGIATCGVDR
jgi:hypothetical protein